MSQAPSVPATPRISYIYGTDSDGTANDTGRLKTITIEGAESETLTYDELGRITVRERNIVGQAQPFTLRYEYNLANELKKITYPSGRTVDFSPDSVGRLTTVSTNGTGLVSNLAWNAAGLPTGWTYGNGITASFGWSPERLLLSEIRHDRPQQGGTMFHLVHGYDADPNPEAIKIDGRIRTIQDLVVPARTVEYVYDARGRLSSAETVGGELYPRWCLAWVYDSHSNRVLQRDRNGEVIPPEQTLVCPGNPPELALEFESATNRVDPSSGWTHDPSGNVTSYDFDLSIPGDEGTLFTDAAGRMVGHNPTGGASVSYAYDASGLRGKRTEGPSTTYYLRDGGQVIGEWNGSAWTKELVWLGDKHDLRATIEPGGSVAFSGKRYPSLSTAGGMARKPFHRGDLKGKPYPQTNGWIFWQIRDADTGKLVALDILRERYIERERGEARRFTESVVVRPRSPSA